MAIKDKWLTFISQYLLGYESITVLEEVEKKSLLLMMQCIELLFVVFWEKQANQEETEAAIKILKFIERLIKL